MILKRFPRWFWAYCSETSIAFLITILICLAWSCLRSTDSCTDSCTLQHDDLKRFPRWFWAYCSETTIAFPDHNLDLFGWLMYWLMHRAPWWFETLSPLILSILQWDNDSVPDRNLGWFVCQPLCMFLLVFGIPYTLNFPNSCTMYWEEQRN